MKIIISVVLPIFLAIYSKIKYLFFGEEVRKYFKPAPARVPNKYKCRRTALRNARDSAVTLRSVPLSLSTFSND